MLIRRAVAEDAAQIANVHVRAIREVCRADYDARQIEAWAASKSPARYLSAIAEPAFFVAQIAAEIAGFSQLDANTGEVHAVYVRPDALRRGIGRQLLLQLEQSAAELGLKRLQLHSSLSAVPFYLAHGYVVEATTSFSPAPGVELACLRMHRALAESALKSV
jgi:putative acetyltransferase